MFDRRIPGLAPLAALSLTVACGAPAEPSLLIGHWSNGITRQTVVDPALGAAQPQGVYVEFRPDGRYFALAISAPTTGYVGAYHGPYIVASTLDGTWRESVAGRVVVSGSGASQVWAMDGVDGGPTPLSSSLDTIERQGNWGLTATGSDRTLVLDTTLTTSGGYSPSDGYFLGSLDPPRELPAIGPLPTWLVGSWASQTISAEERRFDIVIAADGQFHATYNYSYQSQMSTTVVYYSENNEFLGTLASGFPDGRTFDARNAHLDRSTYNQYCAEGRCGSSGGSASYSDVGLVLRFEPNPVAGTVTVDFLGVRTPVPVQWSGLFPRDIRHQ